MLIPTPAPPATSVPPRAEYLVKHPATGVEVKLTKEQFDEFLSIGRMPESGTSEKTAGSPETAAASSPSSPPRLPEPTPTPGNGEMSLDSPQLAQELAYLVHQLINEEREKQGLGPLQYDAELASIAEAHSNDMAMHSYFSHVNLAGEDPTDRGAQQGYNCRKDYGSHYTYGLAENIHQGWLYGSITYIGAAVIKDWHSVEELATIAVQGWMNSPGHRANILNRSYDKEGIGVAVAPDERVYFTQNFC